MMAKVRFLHVTKDDKFAYPVRDGFSKWDEVISEYVCYHPSDSPLKYIHEGDEIMVFHKAADFINKLRSNDYDVLYLHSLQLNFYPFIKYIPSEKIVIWWAFGFDIYGGQVMDMKSFVNIDCFKPKTLQIRKQAPLLVKIKRLYAKLFLYPKIACQGSMFLRRVDYFQPVISVDYDLMKEKTGFKAKEIYLPVFGNFSTGKEQTINLIAEGAILIANSAEYAENHLDIWESIRIYVNKNQHLLVPLSYGDRYYASKVKTGMQDGIHKFFFLDTYLPRDEYFSLFDNCSYAVFGSIRQHAMGNVYNALLRGLKVFLYKDSYIYKYLVVRGCLVFPIEEVREGSFSTPLTAEEQQRNFNALYKEQSDHRKIYKEVFAEIKQKVNEYRRTKENV